MMNKMIADYCIDYAVITYQNKVVRLTQVIYFESEKNYVDCHCSGEVIWIRISLKKLSKIIDDFNVDYFYRINKSILINMTYFLSFGGDVILVGNITLTISW